MIAVSSAQGETTSVAPGTPCVFKGCRGFFHPGAGPVGIVLCAPWGFEDLTVRKSWRLLAEGVAKAGFPTLRFDYPGTGDALGAMTDIADIAQWTQSVGAAADFLRAYSGVKRFVFVGQSLGAALAAQAAGLRADVAALLLVTPVVSGRAYLHDLAETAQFASDKFGIGAQTDGDGGINLLGFRLSKPLVESLRRLDLTKSASGGLANAIVFDRADRKAGPEVSEHFRRNGVASRFEIIPPHRLAISDTTRIQPLPVTVERIVDVLAQLYPHPASQKTARAPLMPATLRAPTFKEELLCFGDAVPLCGILCHPAVPQPDAPALIFLNRGLTPQIGWARGAVEQARALAALGFSSLRIDGAGLGESTDAPGRVVAHLYADAILDDVRAAVDALAARGHGRIALCGVSSAATMALAAAAIDPRITDVVAVNAQRFVLHPGDDCEALIRFGLRSLHDYVGGLGWRGALRKLVKHRKKLTPPLRFFVGRQLGAVLDRLPKLIRTALLRDPTPHRVDRLFATLAERGTHVSLVYADADPGLLALRAAFGPRGRDLRLPNVALSIVPEADHNLMAARASAWLLDHLAALGGAPPPREDPEVAALRARRAAEAFVPAREIALAAS